MKYNEVGKTGIFVSELGFGAWGIGGVSKGASSYGVVEPKTALKALKFAFSRGINFFDTANVYGAGTSEILIGQAFSGMRQEVVISSKIGLVDFDTKLIMDEQSIRGSLFDSLQRLGTDYIDVLHLHKVTTDELCENENILRVMEALRKEGLVRALAISVNNPNDASHPIVLGNFDAVQLNFSLLDMRVVENNFLQEASNSKASIIARTPLNFGFLAENFPLDVEFSFDDHRSLWPKAQLHHWIKGANIMLKAAGVKDLDCLNERVCASLRFCMSFESVASTIPGMLNTQQVLLNIEATKCEKFNYEELTKLLLTHKKWDKMAYS